MIEKIIKRIILEATTTSRNSVYVSPLLPGYREFEKHINGPFTEYATEWDDPLLDYDSLDGKMSTKKSEIKKREKRAEKISNFIKTHPDAFAQDGDGGLINALNGKNVDSKPIKNFDPKKTTTSIDGIKKKINEDGNVINQYPEKNMNIVPIKEWIFLDDILIKEDLAVWFGTKKKPKGSKQPKGPWVDICRKVNGKHPPCGRSDADSGAYPKCRAAGVAGKMSDSAKRSACQQKRKAEKQDTQTGKGQKPVMTSYKPRKKKTQNESLDDLVRKILKTI
jgi:hypothetical protein